MTNDKELVEVWRAEHKALLLATNNWCLADFQELDGVYYDWHLQSSWEGFVMAKRSQPSVVLPDPYVDYDEDDNPCKYWTKKQIDERLTAAGIKYKIGNDYA